MYVLKRDGQKEPVSFDKITIRIQRLAEGIEHIDPVLIAQKVVNGVFAGVKTRDLDNLAAETAAYMITEHPNYGTLASRLAVSNLHKETSKSFSQVIARLKNYKTPKNGLKAPLISDEAFAFVTANAKVLDEAIDYQRDYNFEYFGFKTMQRSYLLKIDGEIVERPQHLLMRAAVGIHMGDIASVLETYHWMSQGFFIHASPTLFNAATTRPQLSSCFLLTMKEDSIDGIYETLKRCALISKSAGGIGLSVSSIRATGSYIRGTNGMSNGLVPMLRVFNDTARYVDQGGAKRPGAFAVYMEPWHADIFDFLELKKNTGKEEHRARDLFYALWVPDLFMKRVETGGSWSLFCPNEALGLADTWGEEFETLYHKYESEGRARKVVQAQDLWFSILESQIETGTPFVLYKDACNRKSNQQNLGTIKCSNLCTEIVEYTDANEVAVCNLASIALPKFVDLQTQTFNHQKLYEVTRIITRNLNKVIDVNYYPIEEARRGNLRHRPIGIGVQGLADTFALLRMPFDSAAARKLNREIFETIYYAAVTMSKDLAKEEGHYETYPGSPISKGLFQFDLWGAEPSPRWDWETLRTEVKVHGVRNSLLVAPMPTASTSQILGNNECIEPYTSNIYTRRVLSGEFAIVNRHLLKDLMERGLWNSEMKNRIIAGDGSIQHIDSIPQELKDIYKTVWEIKQRTLVDMAADRGAFIDQSQSFNVFIAQPDFAKLTTIHFYGWKKGLKTGMYYLRTQPAAKAIQFTVDQESLKKKVEDKAPEVAPVVVAKQIATSPSPSDPKKRKSEPEVEGDFCRMEAGCMMCGS